MEKSANYPYHLLRMIFQTRSSSRNLFRPLARNHYPILTFPTPKLLSHLKRKKQR